MCVCAYVVCERVRVRVCVVCVHVYSVCVRAYSVCGEGGIKEGETIRVPEQALLNYKLINIRAIVIL